MNPKFIFCGLAAENSIGDNLNNLVALCNIGRKDCSEIAVVFQAVVEVIT